FHQISTSGSGDVPIEPHINSLTARPVGILVFFWIGDGVGFRIGIRFAWIISRIDISLGKASSSGGRCRSKVKLGHSRARIITSQDGLGTSGRRTNLDTATVVNKNIVSRSTV